MNFIKSYANEEISKKAKKSEQFQEVALFLAVIAPEGKIASNFTYLCTCPWTDKKLDATVKNIDTTKFCQLFSMKPTSCARHLRRYKELFYK